jgi:hypothetical protein
MLIVYTTVSQTLPLNQSQVVYADIRITETKFIIAINFNNSELVKSTAVVDQDSYGWQCMNERIRGETDFMHAKVTSNGVRFLLRTMHYKLSKNDNFDI